MEITNIVSTGDAGEWFTLTGTDYGTGIEFDGDEFRRLTDGLILDSDGCPMGEDDWETIAVNNSLSRLDKKGQK